MMAKSTKSKSSTKSADPVKSPGKKKSTKATTESLVAVSDSQPAPPERRGAERRKVQRRRQIDPTTCERDYSTQEIEFMRAMDEYKRASGRMFPTCSEILEVFRGLGYIHPADQAELAASQPGDGETLVDPAKSVIPPLKGDVSSTASYVDTQ